MKFLRNFSSDDKERKATPGGSAINHFFHFCVLWVGGGREFSCLKLSMAKNYLIIHLIERWSQFFFRLPSKLLVEGCAALFALIFMSFPLVASNTKSVREGAFGVLKTRSISCSEKQIGFEATPRALRARTMNSRTCKKPARILNGLDKLQI